MTSARPQAVWDAIRDIGALHTRLVPGFVVDTRLEPGARIVTFANGMVMKEPIVTVDDDDRRLVWTAEGGVHSLQRVGPGLRRRHWQPRRLDRRLLPDEAAPVVGPMVEQGMAAMKKALDASDG